LLLLLLFIAIKYLDIIDYYEKNLVTFFLLTLIIVVKDMFFHF